MGKSKKKAVGCTPATCGIEEKLEKVFDKFTKIAEKLADNQNIMQIQIQKLSDNIEIIGKVERRMDKLDDQIKENSMVIYKIMGIGMVAAMAVPVLLRNFLG